MNVFEIEKEKQQEYLKNYSDFSFVIAIEAILRKKSKGKLYINCIDSPTIFIIWNEFDGFYVSLTSDEDIKFIKEAILTILKQNKVEQTEFVIYIDSKYDKYIDEIIPVSKYSKLEVLFYSSDENLKFSLHTSNYSFLDIKEINNYNELDGIANVKETIMTTWYNIESFLQYGTGILAVDESNQAIVGYCISEHVTNESVEFSIEIEDNYQSRGIGTLIGKAMLNRCYEISKKPCWYCTDDNIGSIKLAEKLGLMKNQDFHVWFFEIDEAFSTD